MSLEKFHVNASPNEGARVLPSNGDPGLSRVETPNRKPDQQIHPVHKTVTSFLLDIDSIRSTAGFTTVLLSGISKVLRKRFDEHLHSCPPVEGKPGVYRVPVEKLRRNSRLDDESTRSERAAQIVPRSMVVALVSQYDAFLSALVEELFRLQPGLMNVSNRTIAYSELLTFGSIEEAKRAVLASELESLIRESHHEQFAWLERRFDVKTLTSFSKWPVFIEVTQRRNLFVHNDGRVSKQYLNVMEEHGAAIVGIKAGDQLEADASYVRGASDVLYEVAVKLSQVLWRKVIPQEVQVADESLSDITYSLLENKRYKLAISLLDFAFDNIKRWSSPEIRLRWSINRANAYRLSGDSERARFLIRQDDWTAYDPAFRMGAHLLLGEMNEAIKCMRQIGTTGSVSKTAYREWPLFEVFRDDPSFRRAFSEIFNEELLVEGEEASKGEGTSTEFIFESLLADDLKTA